MIIDMSKMGVPVGGGQAPGAMPIDISVQFDIVQTVKSVDPDGAANVAQRAEGVAIKYGMNGQPIPMPANMAGGQQPVGPSFQMKVSPTGRVLERQGDPSPRAQGFMGGPDPSQIFGSGTLGLGMLLLPAEPVHVGQQWEEQVTTQIPLMLPGSPAAGAASTVTYKVTNTLKEIQGKGERQIAVIESRMEAGLPRAEGTAPQEGNPAGPGASGASHFSQTLTATHLFDLSGGELRTADRSTKLGMVLRMGFPGAAAGAAGSGVGVEGDFRMKVALVPDAPIGPAAGASKRAAPAKPPAAAKRPAKTGVRSRE
jgi:hypothetical protein